ncbi:patatin-like phospholipase family protein [Aurantivibrio infirmus]
MDKATKIGLAISGGGYRATLYSLGSLWRLNDFGLLPRIKTITSVSGGSITTGYLASKWESLNFDDRGVAGNFKSEIASPLQAFCSQNLDVMAAIRGIFSFTNSVGDEVAKAYDKNLFHGAKLQDLSDHSPEFLFYGTNYQTGSSVRIEKSKLLDYKIGLYPNPDLSMAKVAGISSAFPPVMSPVIVKTNPDLWLEIPTAKYFNNRKLRKKLILSDGGVYDNLGLEAIWKNSGHYSHVLACDAGAPFSISPKVKTNWFSQFLRASSIMTDQQRALRKRKLLENYLNLDAEGRHKVYGGTYFGITTHIGDYDFYDSMCKDTATTESLQNIRTRLNKFTEREQAYLINWGYALTDTAIRRWSSELLTDDLNRKGEWPFSKYSL